MKQPNPKPKPAPGIDKTQQLNNPQRWTKPNELQTTKTTPTNYQTKTALLNSIIAYYQTQKTDKTALQYKSQS
jgi:hypothetical protein